MLEKNFNNLRLPGALLLTDLQLERNRNYYRGNYKPDIPHKKLKNSDGVISIARGAGGRGL